MEIFLRKEPVNRYVIFIYSMQAHLFCKKVFWPVIEIFLAFPRLQYWNFLKTFYA